MAKELQVKEFSALPVADDGKTLLYTDGEVKQSRKNLSEMLTDEVNNKLDTTAFSTVSGSFLTAHQIIPSGKWENVSDVVIANSATWGTETDWTDDINAASGYALSEAKDWVEEQNYITGVDLTNYYTKSETSGSNEIGAALDGKEDKVFVAEYNVTTYAAIKDAYDAGKQIICKYVENETQTKYLSLSQFVKPANIFIFSDWATYRQSIYVHFTLNPDGNTGYQVINDWYYTQNETSGRNELTNAFNAKQDILTFSGENNTITSINNSAIGGGSITGEYVPLSATACSIGNNTATAPQSFSQGVNNQCLGTESFTQGNGNSAYNGSFAQGRNCYASNYSIAQGSDCSALEEANQAFGRGTVISSVGMAIGQYNKTSANVAFVIGNGDASDRSDLFVIDKYGNVSAKKGYFYDKDGKVGGGVGGAVGDYVPLSAVECTIGSGNSSISGSLSQGENNLAGRIIVHPETIIEGELEPEYTEVLGYSFAQGKENSAYGYSITQGNHNEASDGAMAQGYDNKASECSMAQGYHNVASYFAMSQGNYNSAYQNSFAQGEYNYAYDTGAGFGTRNSAIKYSFTQGETVSAKNYSFAAGKYNYAENYSQTFGFGLKATNYATAYGYDGDVVTLGSFVIGEFNKTSAAPFVIGNGTFEGNRSDLFVVDKDGNVSAQGHIYAEGVVLGASLDTLELAPDNETIEFVTSLHNVVNGEGDPEEYTVIKIKSSLLDKINKIDELYNLVSSNSGTSNWNLPQ